MFPSANTDSLALFFSNWQHERAATLGHLAVPPGMDIFLIVLGWGLLAQLSQSALVVRGGDPWRACERESATLPATLYPPGHQHLKSGRSGGIVKPLPTPTTKHPPTGICIREGVFCTAGSISALSDRLCGGLVSRL